MRPFTFERAADAASAIRHDGAQFLAGGTNLLDLMKLDVMRPERVVDINALKAEYGRIALDATELRLGALVRMAEAAAHPEIRGNWGVIAGALRQAASAQLRNM